MKDINFKGKKSKVRKYISSKPPTDDEIENLSRKFAFEIEVEAAKKIAAIASKYYEFDYLSEKYIKSIEEFRDLYKRITDFLDTNEKEKYEQEFEIKYVQGTTSIEGNTFSLEEVRDLIVHGILPNGKKSLREINEIQNFRKVKIYRDRYKGKVCLSFIKNLHSLIMNNIDREGEGNFRRTDLIGISGCDLRPIPSIYIEDKLTEIINEYYSNLKKKKHPLEQIIMFHYKFEMVHPFTDGNGRVGREIFNYMLNKEGYPRLLFLSKDRDAYISALRLGNESNYDEMLKTFADIIDNQRIDILRNYALKAQNCI